MDYLEFIVDNSPESELRCFRKHLLALHGMTIACKWVYVHVCVFRTKAAVKLQGATLARRPRNTLDSSHICFEVFQILACLETYCCQFFAHPQIESGCTKKPGCSL